MFKKIPHTYAIVFYVILIAAITTWFIPGGEYHEQTVVKDGESSQQMVFERTENHPQSWQIFAALFKGFEKQAGIIIFILMIGGAFWILNASKAIDAGIMSFLRISRKMEKVKLIRKLGADNIILSLIMILFSLFGAVFGMSEETIAFIIILVPLSISMGYDSIVGVCLVFVAAALGFAGAMLNPFTVGIAQSIAGLPLFSGLEYRFICWLILTFTGVVFTLHYAAKVKKDPTKSPVYEEDDYWRKRSTTNDQTINYYTPLSARISFGITAVSLILFSVFYPQTGIHIGNPESGAGLSFQFPIIPVLTAFFIITGILTLLKSVHFYILNLLAFTVFYLIAGVMGYGWYIMEIATLFFALGICAGIAMNFSANGIVKLFLEGCRDIMSAAIIVGLAGGIIVILEEGKVIDTILYVMAKGMNSCCSQEIIDRN
jgi:uncharacterized ion transporter superfamily protein YfcC